MQKLDSTTLAALAKAHTPAPCKCALGACTGWESFTEDRWPKDRMRPLGSLRDPDIYEPTVEEFHPHGTRYASPDAPLAVNFFPCNISDVYACDRCQQVVLRYTEFGGYYVDHRLREIDPARVLIA